MEGHWDIARLTTLDEHMPHPPRPMSEHERRAQLEVAFPFWHRWNEYVHRFERFHAREHVDIGGEAG